MRALLQVVGIVVLAASVGAAVGAIVATRWGEGSPAPEPTPTTTHLAYIRQLFNADWPHVQASEDWYTSLYNAQTPLEDEWSELSRRISVDGIGLVRARVEGWRGRYADWVEDASERLSGLEVSDPHYESIEAVHDRGQRILRHVEAILDQ